MCSETSEAVGTTWEHTQLEFQKFLNPPTFNLRQNGIDGRSIQQQVLGLDHKLSIISKRKNDQL